jgi:glyoxylase-like metal-dependent hydrolase (beta-lactamase superfamily II)
MQRHLAAKCARIGFLLSAVVGTTAPSGAQVTETDDHIVTSVAPGVYAIRHKRSVRIGALSGTTTVVIGDRDVLVVDPGSLPSIAAGDIALIRRWTTKPVRYVVNTHWHGDHTWGNGVYADSFPGVAIIAHVGTPALMQGYLTNFLPRYVATANQAIRSAETGRDADGKPLTAARRTELTADLPNARIRAAEYSTLVTRVPTLTFDHELTLDLRGREVQLKFLGRGNTSSDIVAWLPREKIIATGDILVYPYQFYLGGYPVEWSRTLERVAQLGPQTFIPGHGAVLGAADGLAYVSVIREILDVVAVAVRDEVFKQGNIPPNDTEQLQRGHFIAVKDAVKKRPEILALRERFGRGDADRLAFFDSAMPNVIDSAYREAWGN